MKPTKYIAFILSMMCVIPLLFSYTSRRGISSSCVKVGMTADEFSALLDSSETYVGYDGNRRLFRDKNNKSVTVTLSDGEKTITSVANIDGYVAQCPKGENGFGFDEIFELEDGRTLAELSAEEKNQISARKKALELLKEQV